MLNRIVLFNLLTRAAILGLLSKHCHYSSAQRSKQTTNKQTNTNNSQTTAANTEVTGRAPDN
jgi:hypothetical protein